MAFFKSLRTKSEFSPFFFNTKLSQDWIFPPSLLRRASLSVNKWQWGTLKNFLSVSSPLLFSPLLSFVPEQPWLSVSPVVVDPVVPSVAARHGGIKSSSWTMQHFPFILSTPQFAGIFFLLATTYQSILSTVRLYGIGELGWNYVGIDTEFVALGG